LRWKALEGARWQKLATKLVGRDGTGVWKLALTASTVRNMRHFWAKMVRPLGRASPLFGFPSDLGLRVSRLGAQRFRLCRGYGGQDGGQAGSAGLWSLDLLRHREAVI